MKQTLSPKFGALCISHTLAIHAWCENHDEAAAGWLREKYTSMVTELSADRLLHRSAIESAVRLTFERTLAVLESAMAAPPIRRLLCGIALQVCTELQADSLLLAA